MNNPMKPTANQAWFTAVTNLLYGQPGVTVRRTNPRGMMCYEMTTPTVTVVDPYYPLVSIVDRRLNYKFAAAEALWIVEGRDDLAYLTAFNKNMAQFSDDGLTLAGAYGPRINAQLDYVVYKLLEDRDSRQAVLTIWERNPQPSRDIPCTVAMSFMLRGKRLYCSVFMRSSDVYLGLPYDMFSFSMVMRRVLSEYVKRADRIGHGYLLGELYIFAASSHLYDRDIAMLLWMNDVDCETDLKRHDKLHGRFASVTSWQVAEDHLNEMMRGDR